MFGIKFLKEIYDESYLRNILIVKTGKCNRPYRVLTQEDYNRLEDHMSYLEERLARLELKLFPINQIVDVSTTTTGFKKAQFKTEIKVQPKPKQVKTKPVAKRKPAVKKKASK